MACHNGFPRVVLGSHRDELVSDDRLENIEISEFENSTVLSSYLVQSGSGTVFVKGMMNML